MSERTMSHWELQMREHGQKDSADILHTEKMQDLQRLRDSGLPQFAWFDCSYCDFTNRNNRLIEFFSRNRGLTVRALPTSDGMKKGFARHYKNGVVSFQEAEEFLRANVERPYEFWNVSLSEWSPNRYGFILISNTMKITGEIGTSLEKLSHGEENPLASFEIRRRFLGHISDKTFWETRRDEIAAEKLLQAYWLISFPGGNFDSYCRRGYFEGVVTTGNEIKFLDYKVNESYLA